MCAGKILMFIGELAITFRVFIFRKHWQRHVQTTGENMMIPLSTKKQASTTCNL